MTDQSTLIKIRNYGALKYTPEKICSILALHGDDKDRFLVEFDNQESDIRIFYEQGYAIGDYNIDAELAKKSEKGDIFAIVELGKRQYYNTVNRLKKDLFGV